MQVSIGEIAEKVITVTPTTKCEYVYSLFIESPSLEGIVVCSDQQPVGLMMKTQFYQKLSTKYGFDLFMNRTIDLVMNMEPLIVDYSLPITEVSAQAMDREQTNLYDYVIVTAQDELVGIVSIRNLLIKLAEVQISIARYSSPLTGLPGNFEIKNALQNALSFKKFSVLYIDINSFKVFNDSFGFKQGDEVIQGAASIIEDAIHSNRQEQTFVGHIGGDDFIAIVPHHKYDDICQTIIEQFDLMAGSFYTEKELEQGFVRAHNRKGNLEDIPMIGVSIAVVTNRYSTFGSTEELSKEAALLKKRCKSLRRSVYLTREICDDLQCYQGN